MDRAVGSRHDCEATVIGNPALEGALDALAYRPTFVRALAMVPIGARDHEVRALAELAAATATALSQFLPATR